MTQRVSDEVWQQLDPQAGRLPRRTVRRLRWALTLGAALTLAVAAIAWSGVLVPRIGWTINGSYSYSVTPDEVTYDVHIVNRGRTSIEVLGVGRGGDGLELIKVDPIPHLPARLDSGAVLRVNLVYRVTDCTAVTADAWPVPVRIRRFWGVHTGYVQPPTLTSRDAPDGPRFYVGRDPYAVEWQRALADDACALRQGR